MSNNIVIVGAGAIGSFYGGKLALAGARVSVVCRSDYETVKERGYSITSKDGDFHFTPQHVLKKINDYPGTPDMIIVATKVLPTIDVVELIKDKVGPKTVIALIQNGIEIEEPVARAFPDNEIISGLAFICVSRRAPGQVEHQDYGRLVIGRYPSGAGSSCRRLEELFAQSGIKCEVTEDVVKSRWIKLIWNAPFNPISVLGGCVDTSEILADEEASKMVKTVMEEVLTLAAACGHTIEPSYIDKNIGDTRKMRPYKPSMLLDHENRRPMEVEAILGNAVRAARRVTVEVPHIFSLYSLLRLVDSSNRK